MIRQGSYSLISNAYKSSGKTDIPAVGIGSLPCNNFVCYYAKDNGVGFDMACIDGPSGAFNKRAAFFFSSPT